jgi:hypothetical protein
MLAHEYGVHSIRPPVESVLLAQSQGWQHKCNVEIEDAGDLNMYLAMIVGP